MFEPTPLILLDAALRGTLLALLLLLVAVLLRDRPQLLAARTGVLLALGLCVQVVSATPWFEDWAPRLWQAPLVAVAVGNAVLFWLFVQALLNDDFALLPVHGLAWAGVAALSGLNCAVVANSGSVVAPITMGLQRAVPLVFSVLTAVAAARHWRADLVEGRRRLRAFIVLTGMAYTLAMLAARLTAPHGRLTHPTATLDVLGLLLIVAVVAWHLLRLTHSDLFPVPVLAAAPTAAPLAEQIIATAAAATTANSDTNADALPPPDLAEQNLALALQRLMDGEHAYRSENLSVTRLAARLAVPEYRLRRLINQRLGHRNFNAYINGFRLTEASAALADPARRDLPVLTIALSAGFQSIGPFNRAFKALTGQTPTEFRLENLADS